MTFTPAAMYIRSPLAEGEDRLTALPAELLVDIVEQLLVREMCRLRSVNRHLHDFVDANQGLLTRDLVGYHRARIEREYKLLTDLSDCDIIDALRRYDRHYGIDHDPETTSSFPFRSFKYTAISLTLDIHWPKSHRLPFTIQHCRGGHWLQIIHFLNTVGDSTKRIDLLAGVWDVTERHRSFGFPEREPFVAKFMAFLSTRAGGAYGYAPRYFLTERKVARRYDGGSSMIQMGHCDDRGMSKLLPSLKLPDLNLDEGTLAYCSMSEDVVDLVDGVDQGPSAVLKRAAVIEEIFIW